MEVRSCDALLSRSKMDGATSGKLDTTTVEGIALLQQVSDYLSRVLQLYPLAKAEAQTSDRNVPAVCLILRRD